MRKTSVTGNWGGDRKNCNGHGEGQKKMNNFEKHVINPTFYVKKWRWQALIQHVIQVSDFEEKLSRLYFS